MTQNFPGTPASKPIGFKTLQEITGYVSVYDGNILKVIVTIAKLQKTDQKDPQGLPIYNAICNINLATLTREEYTAMVKPDIGE